jgi:hypothetical protein
MPRIPQEEPERLKREMSLVRLIRSQGHELRKCEMKVTNSNPAAATVLFGMKVGRTGLRP